VRGLGGGEQGLWLWSKPIPRQDADGSKYHIVLLDSEGIDAYDQTGQYSTQIFSLAVLLSSLFVYNQVSQKRLTVYHRPPRGGRSDLKPISSYRER